MSEKPGKITDVIKPEVMRYCVEVIFAAFVLFFILNRGVEPVIVMLVGIMLAYYVAKGANGISRKINLRDNGIEIKSLIKKNMIPTENIEGMDYYEQTKRKFAFSGSVTNWVCRINLRDGGKVLLEAENYRDMKNKLQKWEQYYLKRINISE